MGGICGARARAGNPDGLVLNMQLIALQAQAHPTSLVQNKAVYHLLHNALRDLRPETGGLDTPISIRPETGQPWRSRFDAHTLAHEERQLQTAAYILCAYLTGMRDGEVQAMRPGCVLRSRSADGMTERLAIRSLVYKGRVPEGEQADWVTIAPAARAVLVAERLAARHRSERDDGGIWTVLHRATAKDRGLPHVVRRINEYRDHLNRHFGTPDNPVVPAVDGRPWVFNTRQFRRTVAWHIANRPFGVIAGKIQYKHASVAMFDGYADPPPVASGRRSRRNGTWVRSTISSPITRRDCGASLWAARLRHASRGNSTGLRARLAPCPASWRTANG